MGPVTYAGTDEPAPYGVTPSAVQLRWSRLGFYGFCHFTVNTFTNKEWGYGDENPNVFNPTAFDPDQIVQTFKAAGMKGVILTCKHHDGFCLWPSAYTDHTVKSSSWKSGKGDVVREISDACHRAGMLFGVYLSPWDRNRADYGSPAYVTYYRNQLRELLTNYGPVFCVWLDGANGGDGYYGGAREKRTIDKDYYGWPETVKIIRQLQPDADIHGLANADSRWVGNERGVAPLTVWNTIDRDAVMATAKWRDLVGQGTSGGPQWLGVEVDVSDRPGWYYHADQDAKVKSHDQLMKIYFESVGRGCDLNLNVPPDHRGRIADADVKTLTEFKAKLDATFAENLAAGAKVTADSVRGNDVERFGPAKLLGDNPDDFYASDDSVPEPTITVRFAKPATVSILRLGEDLALGQRVAGFEIEAQQPGGWHAVATGTTIGSERLLRFSPVNTDALRIRITSSPVAVTLRHLGVFH